MKILLLLLFAANAGYLAWNLSQPAPGPSAPPPFHLPAGATKLVLLEEVEPPPEANPTESMRVAENSTENGQEIPSPPKKKTEPSSPVASRKPKHVNEQPPPEVVALASGETPSGDPAESSAPGMMNLLTELSRFKAVKQETEEPAPNESAKSSERMGETNTGITESLPKPPYAPVAGSDLPAPPVRLDSGTPAAELSQAAPHWTADRFKTLARASLETSSEPSREISSPPARSEKTPHVETAEKPQPRPIATALKPPSLPARDETSSEPEKPKKTASVQPKTCYRTGILTRQADAEQVRDWFDQRGIPAEIEGNNTLLGYRVYLPPVANLDAANRITQVLHHRGFSHARVLRGGELKNAISLGFYREQADAEALLDSLRKKGYPTLRHQPLYKGGKARLWLRLLVPGDQTDLLETYRETFQHARPTVCGK